LALEFSTRLFLQCVSSGTIAVKFLCLILFLELENENNNVIDHSSPMEATKLKEKRFKSVLNNN